jgi:hypothetical protein
LQIYNQEERTTNNEVIGVGERVGEERREVMSEEEEKFNIFGIFTNTERGGESILRKFYHF